MPCGTMCDPVWCALSLREDATALITISHCRHERLSRCGRGRAACCREFGVSRRDLKLKKYPRLRRRLYTGWEEKEGDPGREAER
jgi:hypothetical protein